MFCSSISTSIFQLCSRFRLGLWRSMMCSITVVLNSVRFFLFCFFPLLSLPLSLFSISTLSSSSILLFSPLSSSPSFSPLPSSTSPSLSPFPSPCSLGNCVLQAAASVGLSLWSAGVAGHSGAEETPVRLTEGQVCKGDKVSACACTICRNGPLSSSSC